jgi:hypothetical protein
MKRTCETLFKRRVDTFNIMSSKNSCPKTSFDSLNVAQLKAILKKLEYWIKDEAMAKKAYGDFADCVNDPEFKAKFSSMSSDEGRHEGYHHEMKNRVVAALERKKKILKSLCIGTAGFETTWQKP